MENTKPDLLGTLTDREMEILYLLAEGLRNQQIADQLNAYGIFRIEIYVEIWNTREQFGNGIAVV